jgi:hypothetical protein
MSTASSSITTPRPRLSSHYSSSSLSTPLRPTSPAASSRSASTAPLRSPRGLRAELMEDNLFNLQVNILSKEAELKEREASLEKREEELTIWQQEIEVREACMITKGLELGQREDQMQERETAMAMKVQELQHHKTMLEQHVVGMENRLRLSDRLQTFLSSGATASSTSARTPGMTSPHALCSQCASMISAVISGDAVDSDDKRTSFASTFSMHTPTIPSLPTSSKTSMRTVEMSNPIALNSLRSASSVTPPLLGLSTQQRQLFHLHNIQWNNLDNLKTLSWGSFPWPVFNRLNKPEDLNHNEVKMYLRLLHRFGNEGASLSKEDCLREHYRRWHPDRLEAKVLNKVYERDREKVRMCAKEIARILEKVMQEGLD